MRQHFPSRSVRTRHRLLPALTAALLMASAQAADTPLTGDQPAYPEDGLIAVHNHDTGSRYFQLDPDSVVQFAAQGSGRSTQLRSASPSEQRQLKGLSSHSAGIALKATNGDRVSPVLRDAGGKPWALPGGLIITFADEVSEAEAVARLQAAGLTPDRAINPQVWLVKSPVGLASIEMANALNDRKLFADVSPNWWTPRQLK